MVVLVALVAGAAGAVYARVPQWIVSGHACSDAEAAFAASLGRDPILVQPPQGISPIRQQPHERSFQPCEGNADNRYYGGASLGFDLPKGASPSVAEIEYHYRSLATAHGWQVTRPAPGELTGQKTIDGTAVVFHVLGLTPPGSRKPHETAYWVELRYAGLGSTRYLLTLEDTFR